jgi:hypothetical protein
MGAKIVGQTLKQPLPVEGKTSDDSSRLPNGFPELS